MAPDAEMTHSAKRAAGPRRETAGPGAGAREWRDRVRRPGRAAAATTTLLAAGVLLTGCGDKDAAASKPRRVVGDATPAGVAPPGSTKGGGKEDDSATDGKNSDKKKGRNDGETKGHGSKSSAAASRGAEGSAGGSDGPGGAGAGGDEGTLPGSGGAGSVCTTTDLSASIGPNRPGAGQNHYALVFTNKSGRTCTVSGFPGFAFINASGDQVSVPPKREGSASQPVELSSGASAWAPLSYANPAMTGTRTVTPDAALLTPPDQRASLRVDWTGGPVTADGDASVPKIGPLRPGNGN
ncbi:DUF4232 domain-containing protein [Streptomyces spirodelae]|uniref:DUF4232 domain-containing protein n=1 Tax=Streptomyces spirodelae TaxID=2812904 RepID=A0ABS3WWZ4_9ACTN|nr:DUF4232 domain-containing protein [Streptomyces spirodelae]MBO8187663.1 DUF4232 domain-containing protein [Streptomyces spirodelae]